MYPDLPYFDKSYIGDYPSNSPVTIEELETIYPKANLDCKNDEARMEEAREALAILQDESKEEHK